MIGAVLGKNSSVSFQDVSEVSIGPFFWRKIPKAYSKSRLFYTLKVSRDVSYPKKECQIDNWPSSIELFFFDSVQEWTFLDPDWLVASLHIILYPFMIRIPLCPNKIHGVCSTFLSLPSIISLLW